jgi:hypothetical protein
MSIVIQRSFSGGEISPSLFSRVDTVKYATGVRTLRNFFIHRHGGVSNRPGTVLVAEVKDSTKTIRFIPFIFNDSQTYVLEFGDLYMRVHQEGVQLTDLTLVITGVSNANPGVVTYTGTDPVEGQEVYISGVVGAIGTYLNNRNFKIGTVNGGANTFQLKTMASGNFNTTSLGAYGSAGTADRVYTISTPYVEADLSDLQFVQSADVITIVHPNYAPRDLSRTGHTTWTLTAITFAPSITAPTNVADDSGTTGSAADWVVTTVAQESYEESLQSSAATSSVAPTGGAPIIVSWTAVTGAQEYNVYKKLNGIYGFIGVAGSNTFTDNGIAPDTTDTPPTARNPFALESTKAISAITLASPGVITTATHGYSTGDLIFITGIVGTVQLNDIYFFVTVISTTTFSLTTLSGVAVDTSAYTAWSSAGTAQRAHNYPSAINYVQQRKIYASTTNDPEKCWGSRTAQFENYTISVPLQDDDAVTFSMVGKQVNRVKHLIDLAKFLVLTSGGEWTVEGNDAGFITPSQVNPKQHSYNGSNNLSPLLINGNALYVQARGSIVRDLGFDYQVDGYRGNDLTIFSTHMFEAYQLNDWAYQQIPNSIIWVVRDDGTLLGLTYVREHQLWGWHHHDFDGTVENVCCVPEGIEDAVYICVKRTINGSTKRYIERMTTRLIGDIVDTVIMDSSLSYDGRHAGATTMTLSGGTTWVYTETLTLTASASTFASTDVGNAIHLTGSDDTLIRFTITGYTGATIVTGRAHKTVPVAMRSIAITEWARAVDQLTGLWHIEAESVSVFADGFVVANPNNDAYEVITVTNGTVTLDRPYAVIHVGLPITADLETLDIDTPNGETLIDKNKLVGRVTVSVEGSRGIWVGPKAPSDDTVDPLEDLVELKVRENESYDEPVELLTDSVDINIKSEWNSNGRVFIRQIDPVPLSILAIAPSGLLPFKGGS